MPVHPTAIVDSQAQLHESVEVGPYCVIDANVRIDAGCRLFQGVFVTGWTHIEEGCVLHPHVIVGHAPQDVKYQGERSYCRIGPRTILRENVTVHRGTEPESSTVVGADCFVLAGAHIAHNCRVGNGVTLINNVLLAGHVEVGDRTTIGGATGIHQFVRIGERCMIPGVARVTQDVPPFAMTDTAGRIAGLNRIGMRRAGFSHDEIKAIRALYHRLYDRSQGQAEAIAALAAESHVGPAAKLVEFLKASSRRGLAGRPRGSAQPNSADPSEGVT